MSEQDIPEDLITFDIAAELCGVSVGSFRRWRRQGKLDEHITFYEGDPPEGGGLPVPLVSRAQVEAYLDAQGKDSSGRTHERTRGRTHARTHARTDGHPDLVAARERIAQLEVIVARQRDRIEDDEDIIQALNIQLETLREAQRTYAQAFAGQVRQISDQSAEQAQETYALQVRSSAEVHVAQREAGMLAEQVEDLRKSQEMLSESQKTMAAQYEARISDLRSGHARELEAVRAGAAAQVAAGQAQMVATQESLSRSQAEVDRLVAQGAERDRELAQVRAELAAYRAWAAKGGLGRMFSRPEVPEVPKGLLLGDSE